MTDLKGNPVNVGDHVYVLPDKHNVAGGAGYVRAVQDGEARVDNGPADMGTEMPHDGGWTWSAWVGSAEIEKL